MALSFKNTKGKAQSNKVESYEYKDGENTVRLIGGVLPRYIYWLKGTNNKDIPVEFVNGSAEVRNFGDYFSPVWPVASDDVAVHFESSELTWGQLVARALELADQYGIKSGQVYGLHGVADGSTLAALQVVLPVMNKNSVVLIDQANPDFEAIRKQEKLEQIVLLG